MKKTLFKSLRLNNTFLTLIYIFFFSLLSFTVSAQPPAFEDDIEDEAEPATPIDNGIAAALAAGAILGIYLIAKKEKVSVKN